MALQSQIADWQPSGSRAGAAVPEIMSSLSINICPLSHPTEEYFFHQLSVG